MPLVKCPNCGEDVSDSAEICVHCKCSLKRAAKKESKKTFSDLSSAEQSQYCDEFNAQNKECNRIFYQAQNKKIIDNATWLTSIPHVAVYFIFGFYLRDRIEFESIDLVYFALFILPFCLSFVIYLANLIASVCLRKTWRKRKVIYIAEFDKWLQENKQVALKYSFTKREKMLYHKLYVK